MEKQKGSCPKCGSFNTGIKQKKNLYGEYCTDCGAWMRWVPKAELPVIEPEVVESEKECEYCDRDYVIPISYDGGISGWENVDINFCPMCGKGKMKC